MKDFETNFHKTTLEEVKTKIVNFLKNDEENEAAELKLKYFFIQTFKLIEELYEEIREKKLTSNKKGTKSITTTTPPTQKSKVKTEETVNDTKKSPMKTAGDVVNRIQWDENIKREFMIVGYLDRFLGIKECEFDKFDWENCFGNIAMADIGALAIPEHRIQYFKYKNEVIWDKNQRLDNVYGSTGSNVTILDVIDRLKEADYVKNKSDEEEVAVVGRVKSEPNYFISIPISEKKICDNFEKLTEEIRETCQDLGEILVPVTSLHITLCTLRIDSDDDLITTKKTLDGLYSEFKQYLPIEMKFKNFGMFFNKVLHIKCQTDIEKLNEMKKSVLDSLRKANINLAGNYYDFVPHLTVLKINSKFLSSEKNKGKNNLNNLIDIELLEKYEDFEFGVQNVNELQLCKMVNIFSHQVYPIEFKMNLDKI